MQNTYSTNSGPSASLSRRTFMSLTASGAALTLPASGLAQVPEQTLGNVALPPSPLLDLIQNYAALQATVDELDDRVENLEDCEALTSLPRRRVRYSWLTTGAIDQQTGEPKREPLYVYCDSEIDDLCENDRENWLWRLGGRATRAARLDVEKRVSERKAKLKSELATLERERKKVADRIGLTLAKKNAKTACEQRDQMRNAISDYKPLSLYEAALLARWALDADPCNHDQELFIGVMRVIASAGGLAADTSSAMQRVLDRT